MPSPSLGNSYSKKVDDPISHRVSGLFKSGPSLLDNSADIVPYRDDVFDHDNLGTKHFGSPSHPQVESILGIAAAGVIVEIRVALTGWTADQDVYLADEFRNRLFILGQLAPGNPWKQNRNVLSKDPGIREIRAEYFEGASIGVCSQSHSELIPGPASGLLQSEAHSATSGKEVGDSERDLSVRGLRSECSLEEPSVSPAKLTRAVLALLHPRGRTVGHFLFLRTASCTRRPCIRAQSITSERRQMRPAAIRQIGDGKPGPLRAMASTLCRVTPNSSAISCTPTRSGYMPSSVPLSTDNSQFVRP